MRTFNFSLWHQSNVHVDSRYQNRFAELWRVEQLAFPGLPRQKTLRQARASSGASSCGVRLSPHRSTFSCRPIIQALSYCHVERSCERFLLATESKHLRFVSQLHGQYAHQRCQSSVVSSLELREKQPQILRLVAAGDSLRMTALGWDLCFPRFHPPRRTRPGAPGNSLSFAPTANLPTC